MEKIHLNRINDVCFNGSGKLNYLIVMPLFQSRPNEGYIFPLGIPYISAAMKKAGFNVFTLNLNHLEKPYEVLCEKIIENNINVVMTGGLAPQFAQVHSVFEVARSVDPKITTICGGGIISGDPPAALEALEFIDFGVIGEGELTIVELCDFLENGGDLTGIPGIIFGCPGSYTINARRREIEDINTIPWPDYEGFSYDKFIKISSSYLHGKGYNRSAAILTSRSCPYGCTFCFHTLGPKYRERALDDVFEEIDFLVQNYGIRFLGMLDDVFSRSQKRIEDFCRRIKPYNLPWQTIFRIEDITRSNIQTLQAANCAAVNTGLESADDTILKSMRKGTTIAQIEKALNAAHQMKMPVNGCFIFGDVNETVDTAEKTLRWWMDHPQFGISIKMIKVYPGTSLYHYARKNDIITDPVQFYKEGCPPVNVSKLSSMELSTLVKRITVLPYQHGKTLQNVELLYLDYDTAEVEIQGNCSYCGKVFQWKNYRFFYLGRIFCAHCHGAQNVPLPDEIFALLQTNLEAILKEQRIAFWGMADYSMHFVEKILEVSQYKEKIELPGTFQFHSGYVAVLG
jgi:radical SAM superfamily enzyme YgiQ (UPF0313 family)